MPAQTIRIATLLMERTMCASCIGAEVETDTAAVLARLQTISRILELRREVSDCPRCGPTTIVFSLAGGTRSIHVSGHI